ncbi:CBS domain-containing protein [Saccharothrix variisporea]|uniref:BON domain-containing protein n=1 Tax=Saccharothrix variisporea TaxID=543527 RepID=A0A495XCH5_9PSEU|nr:CBS domain-containing protein [Saccharothrix variisporea]RKT69238.1 BON domain-containing protein [Saccharothrix variisporea]
MREPEIQTVMTREVVTVRPDAAFKEIVERLAAGSFSAVPVVDDDGRPIGVVSEADLLPKEEFRGGVDDRPGVLAGRAPRRRWRQAHGVTAQDLMTAPVRTTTPTTRLSDAAGQLAESGVRRLFVVDRDGRLVGVLSRRDLLSVFLRGDAEVKADVVQQILGRALWLEPAAVAVEVVDGVVTLRGHVERRSELDMALRLTRALPGVVDVESHLSYGWDDTRHATEV